MPATDEERIHLSLGGPLALLVGGLLEPRAVDGHAPPRAIGDLHLAVNDRERRAVEPFAGVRVLLDAELGERARVWCSRQEVQRWLAAYLVGTRLGERSITPGFFIDTLTRSDAFTPSGNV
jgi:hypothetical protein